MKKRFIDSIMIIILAFVVTACGQNVNITFYKDESWILETELFYEQAITEIIFGAVETGISSIDPSLGNLPSLGGIDEVGFGLIFNMTQNQLRSMGYEFDWTKKERAGDVIYTITIKDETIDQFEKLLLENDNNSFHIDHNGVYHLSIDYEQANIEILESLGISDAANINKILSMTTNFTVEIETGKIIDSNADQIMGRTAIWHNPQQLEITFKPKARINILVCLVPLLLLVFVGAGIFLIKSGKARCPSCGTKNSKNSYTCKNCGADLNYGEESGSFVDYFNED